MFQAGEIGQVDGLTGAAVLEPPVTARGHHLAERLQAAGSKETNAAGSAVEANATNRNVGMKGATNRDDADAAEP